MQLANLTKVLNASLEANIAVNLFGNPGLGKSEFLKAYAKNKGYELIHINCAQLEPTDLVLPSIVGSQVNFLPCAWVKKALECEKPVLIFLDEINRIRPEAMNLLTTLVLEKEVYGHRFPDSVRFVAASNFNSNCIATNKLDTAIMARFCHLLFAPSLADSLPYMGSKKAKDFILSVSDLLNEAGQEADFAEVLEEIQVNRRSLTWTMRLFESHELDADLRRAVAQGLLGVPEGSKIAAAYENWLSETSRRIPTTIKGNEAALGDLLKQGMVTEISQIVLNALGKPESSMDALCFMVNHGIPELVRGIILGGTDLKGLKVPSTVVKTLKLTKNLDKLTNDDIPFLVLVAKHTDLFDVKQQTT